MAEDSEFDLHKIAVSPDGREVHVAFRDTTLSGEPGSSFILDEIFQLLFASLRDRCKKREPTPGDAEYLYESSLEEEEMSSFLEEAEVFVLPSQGAPTLEVVEDVGAGMFTNAMVLTTKDGEKRVMLRWN